MPYVVAGTLTLPESSQPAANVTITFRNLMTVSPLIVASESSITTSETGTYSISLQYSVYAVEVTYYNNRPISAGQITLNSETQTGLDLPTLLNVGEYEPATPEWIVQIEAWLAQAQNSATASANSAQASQAQANASAASAAASAASAAQASQISGLGTVTEAVGLAALPLPDVWAPLSDSLRLITGYGRDVLVGSDVVARMMSFSRNTTKTYRAKDGALKVAAVNEPAFERDGLLSEYQSTNFNTKSEGFLSDNTSEGVVTTTLLDGAPGLLFDNTNSAGTSVPSGSPSCTPGQIYTCSFDTDRSLSACAIDWTPAYGISRIPSSSFKEVKVRDDLYRRWATVVGDQSSEHQHFYVATVPGGCKISRIQVEHGSVATSYIPTNGASVTRAADVISVPSMLNWPGDHSVARTVAIEVANTQFDAGYPRIFIYNDGNGGMRYDGVGFASGEAIDSPVFVMTAEQLEERHIHVERHTPSHLQCYASNVGMGPIGNRGNNPEYLNALALSEFASCHLRNFRIWHRELTDAQVKAIA